MSNFGIVKCPNGCGIEMYCGIDDVFPSHICRPPKPKPEIPQTVAIPVAVAAQETYINAQLSGAADGRAANERQVGGDWYNKYGDIQPWDLWQRWNLNPFQASILKYVVRYRDKDGIKDLNKARHFIDKLIEVEANKNV